MKKIVSLICAAMLCACCVVLAACGGSASGSAAASSSAADPAASFVGTWKLAGGESQGVTVVGDFSAILGIEDGFQITLEEGGAGKASMAGETTDLTWETTSDTTIKITPKSSTEDSSASSASAESAEATGDAESADAITQELGDLTLEDGMLTATTTNEGQTAKLIFTQDGTIPGATVIDKSKATPITSEADLIGEWKLSGMNLMGMSAYGDSETIAQMAGGSDTTLTFQEGGKCTMSGTEATYTVSADGATVAQGGTEMPLLALDGNIIIDAGEASGLGIEMIMLYSK